MYADDVCIAFQGPDLSQQYARAQRALDILRPWALENSVQVSLDKTSATAFSPGRRLSKENKAKAGKGGHVRYPGLKYGDEPVKYEAEARFLGLWLDEDFTFERHIAETHSKVGQRIKILKSLSGSNWGCKRKTLRSLHLALIQSCVDFALPAYAPFVREAAVLKNSGRLQ